MLAGLEYEELSLSFYSGHSSESLERAVQTPDQQAGEKWKTEEKTLQEMRVTTT